MSVKLIDNEAFYGYRVRRTINGRLYQEYLTLKKGGKRMGPRLAKSVLNIAQARDAELATAQADSKRKRKAELCFHEDGSVKGIRYLLKTEKSGTQTPIFQVGIASELEGRVICTSFSVNAHGEDLAWEKAVQVYGKHKVIRKGSKLYKQLLSARPTVAVAKSTKRKKRVK